MTSSAGPIKPPTATPTTIAPRSAKPTEIRRECVGLRGVVLIGPTIRPIVYHGRKLVATGTYKGHHILHVMKARLFLGALVVMAGCAKSVSTRADEAYKKRSYLEAAELYDQVVRANPNDTKAAAKRTAARSEALRELLAATSRARVAGKLDQATTSLAELLVRRNSWAMKLDGQAAKELTLEIVAAGSAIATAVTATATSRGPLSAELLAAHYAPLLAHADFQNWRREIEDSVAGVGRTKCEALAPRATTPYWSWVVGTYCQHFGGVDVKVLPRANARTGLVVEGSIVGIPAEDTARIRTTLSAVFRESVWFSPDAPKQARAQLGGKLAVTFDSRPITKTATWTEKVPYTAYEDEQESYQEPYNDQESYSEQVPHTEYRTESRSCGSSTCSETVPTTVYSSETRYRTVTKYRTAYRTVTKPVTRYRDEPRSFTYAAIERSGHYVSALRLRFDRDSPEVVAEVKTDSFERGLDHDVSNADAGVSPQRANLPQLADLTAHEEAQLGTEVKTKLEAAYREAYCRASEFSLEEAAACAYLAPADVPAGVHAALRGAFGDDELQLAAILRR